MLEIKRKRDESTDNPALFRYEASEDGERLGHCVFTLDNETAVILELKTRDNDLMLADGILRAALWDVSDFAKRARLADNINDIGALRFMFGSGGNEARELEDIFKACC